MPVGRGHFEFLRSRSSASLRKIYRKETAERRAAPEMRGLGSSGPSGGGLPHRSGCILPTSSRTPRRGARSQALPGSSSPYASEFAVLGLSPFASASDVKRAYKRLALKYHPDVIRRETRPEKEELFKEIKSAYESLMVKLEGESTQESSPNLGDHDEWDEWDEWMGFEGGTPIFFTPS